MKYFLPIVALSLLLVACKKDRTCKCTITTSGTTSTRATSEAAGIDTTIITPLYTTNQVETKLKEVSKKNAKFNCNDKEENINESIPNGVPGLFSVTITNTGTRKYSCELK